MSDLDIYIGYEARQGNDPLHWIVLLAPPGSERGTWYHVTGGPMESTGYALEIQRNQQMSRSGIVSKAKVSTIAARDVDKFDAAARSVPLQRCQRWTVALLAKLETKDLLPPGTSAHFEKKVEPTRYEQPSRRGPAWCPGRR